MKRAPHPMQLALGFIVWSAWFVLNYGALSIGCAIAPPDVQAGALTWINAALVLLAVLTALALLLCARACWRARLATVAEPPASARFVAPVAAALHAAAAAATLFVGLPALWTPPCL
ncbi:hypothetical protein [Caldimonas thermodepolymerans]|uniref:hypothetical protein n=1 Tax=Caldimonas thermodepolymerans TaxID=215580 RepID=UPI00223627BB|nr:hypothetical protein [Caldimonas thermodepolymerans]UZG43332.1 hypothetical protein ONZ46_13090 [Caldimonas thermodepolymerans]